MVNLLIGIILSASVSIDKEEVKTPNNVAIEYEIIIAPKLEILESLTALEGEVVQLNTAVLYDVKDVIPRSDAELPDT